MRLAETGTEARWRRDVRSWIDSGRWIPWSFVAMLALVGLANAAMVLLALESWPGLVSSNAYKEGLRYNDTLAAERAQEARGWRLAIEARRLGPERLRLAVALTDREGRPLEAQEVEARFSRPAEEGFDRVEPLAALGAGRFAVEVELPLSGVWDVSVAARRGEAVQRAAQRLFLAP